MRSQMQQHKHAMDNWAIGVEIQENQRVRELEKGKLRKAKEALSARRRYRLLEWLSPASSDMFQEICVNARSDYPAAGRWLLNDERFQQWFHPNFCAHPLIWLCGVPGAGI